MRPLGYETDRVTIRASEAEHIREAARRLLAGESLRQVTRSLNEAGATTPSGNPLKPNVLRRVLTSPRVAGREPWKDGKTREARWPAIIEESDRKRLVKLFSDESRRNNPTQTSRVYLLTGGLAVCGLCGTALVARPNNNKRRGYVCASGPPNRGCGRIRIVADEFEDAVAEQVLARLLRGDTRSRLVAALNAVRERADEAPQVIETAHGRLEQIGRDYADGHIGAPEMRAARDRLQDRVSKARGAARLGATLEQVTAMDSDELVAWWDMADLDHQRAIIEAVVSKITVHPVAVRGSKIFDPSRISITWRRA